MSRERSSADGRENFPSECGIQPNPTRQRQSHNPTTRGEHGTHAKIQAPCALDLDFELNDSTPCILDVGKREGRFVNNYFDGIPVRGIHALLFFIIMAAYFFEQFDNWNFGFVAPALSQSWGLKPTDIATILFWYFIGMTSGGFVGGVISDLIGRRKTFLISIVIFSVSSIITGFTDSFVVFTIFRALTASACSA